MTTRMPCTGEFQALWFKLVASVINCPSISVILDFEGLGVTTNNTKPFYITNQYIATTGMTFSGNVILASNSLTSGNSTIPVKSYGSTFIYKQAGSIFIDYEPGFTTSAFTYDYIADASGFSLYAWSGVTATLIETFTGTLTNWVYKHTVDTVANPAYLTADRLEFRTSGEVGLDNFRFTIVPISKNSTNTSTIVVSAQKTDVVTPGSAFNVGDLTTYGLYKFSNVFGNQGSGTGDKLYIIETVGTTNFINYGASSNTVGTLFIFENPLGASVSPVPGTGKVYDYYEYQKSYLTDQYDEYGITFSNARIVSTVADGGIIASIPFASTNGIKFISPISGTSFSIFFDKLSTDPKFILQSMLIDFTSNGSTNSISIQTVGSNLSVQTIDTIITGNTSIWNYNYSVPLINHIGGINDIKEIRFVPANSNSIIAIDNIRFNVSYDYNICITSTNTGSFTATLDFELPSIQTSIASSGAGLRYVTNEYEHYGVTFTNGVIHQNSADGAVGVLNSISPYRKARGGPKFIRPITGQIYYINLDIINYEFLNIVIDYAYNNNTFTISGVEADLTETLLVSATSGGFTWKYDFTIPSFQPNFTKLKFGGFPTSISAIDNIRITARPR